MLFYNVIKVLEHPFREDLVVKITFFSSILLNLFMWIVLYIKLFPFSYLTEYGQIYLHYNVQFGIDNIGQWYYAFILPILGLVIIFFNNIVAYLFYLKDKAISYILLISQSIVQVILFLAGIYIILLNI